MARISLSAAVLLASAGQCAAFVVGPAAGAALRPSLRAAACPTPIVMAAQPAPLSRREVRLPWHTSPAPAAQVCSLADLRTLELTQVERGADGSPASFPQALGAFAVAGAWVRPHPDPPHPLSIRVTRVSSRARAGVSRTSPPLPHGPGAWPLPLPSVGAIPVLSAALAWTPAARQKERPHTVPHLGRLRRRSPPSPRERTLLSRCVPRIALSVLCACRRRAC